MTQLVALLGMQYCLARLLWRIPLMVIYVYIIVSQVFVYTAWILVIRYGLYHYYIIDMPTKYAIYCHVNVNESQSDSHQGLSDNL